MVFGTSKQIDKCPAEMLMARIIVTSAAKQVCNMILSIRVCLGGSIVAQRVKPASHI